ncbi:MAG TPA: MFS transporter [Bdellovibrionota bacterium]|nr:MFS transporter [Bdellovibrionota bacterium]
MSTTAERENRVLSRITLITALGDFLSFFAVLQWLNQTGVSAIIGGFSVVLKSLAVGAGGILLPLALRKFSTRTVMIASQFVSFITASGLLAMILLGRNDVWPIFTLFFVQSLLKQLFDGARESHSQALASHDEQMTLQAQLLSSFFGAQFIGPVVSFILIRFLRIEIPVALDALSFLVAGVMATAVEKRRVQMEAIHVLRPLKYIWSRPLLRDIFLLRSVGFWFSIGLFNYLLFSVVSEHYGLTLVYSAWVYSLMGLGAAISATWLRSPDGFKKTRFAGLNEGVMAMVAQIAFAITILAFIRLPSFSVALVVLVGTGLVMGLNAVATQTIRRKLCAADEFPEVVGLELVVGRLSDGLVSSIAGLSIAAGIVGYQGWLVVAAVVLFGSAAMHSRFIQKSAWQVLVAPVRGD